MFPLSFSMQTNYCKVLVWFDMYSQVIVITLASIAIFVPLLIQIIHMIVKT